MAVARDGLLRLLARAPRAVLALDYDGTLAPFRRRPPDAQPYPGVRETLRGIMTDGRTRVVVITGRPAREVRALLALSPAPEIWGGHGWERLRDGRPPERAPIDAVTAEALREARAALKAAGLADRAEWKAAGVAVHWRGAVDAAAIEATAWTALSRLAAYPDFEIRPMAAGLEWVCRRHHKGTALATVLAEEDPAVPIAYLGDDRTDEDAFRVLANRGLALRVGTEDTETLAAGRLAPGDGVVAFLRHWHEATGAPRPASAEEWRTT